MIKQHSWTRKLYEKACRHFRRGFSFEILLENWEDDQRIVKAADYSYQAKDYEIHGWLSDARRKRFYQIFWRVVTARGELPF